MTRPQKRAMQTQTLPVDSSQLGSFTVQAAKDDILDELDIKLNPDSTAARNIKIAAKSLQTSDVPVAFPTETVYGLGADATRSAAVKGIYKAKQRPSDNPLIVHFASLRQLRSLLRGHTSTREHELVNLGGDNDPIPDIYRPLITRFWPGPLTIILPNPPDSPLAPEVTAGLATFGARMPRHPLALALIHLADLPVAAPSANASTKPSPTAAEHVSYDLDGRIEIILDGGPCDVGVESTVVDGLSRPPLILRPGGISLEQIRSCPGWEDTQIGYQNVAEKESAPKAPGMKYRHYSPKATVVLYEVGKQPPTVGDIAQQVGPHRRIGIIRTKSWVPESSGFMSLNRTQRLVSIDESVGNINGTHAQRGFAGLLRSMRTTNIAKSALAQRSIVAKETKLQLLEIDLGPHTMNIARGIFSALRDLDRENVDAIFVEGISEDEGDTAAAIMNRLRKAAEIRVEG